MQLSHRFLVSLRLSKRNQYEIAWEAGVHPNTLSKLVNGIERVREDDDRIIAVGRVLGIPPKECFANENAENGEAL